MRPGEVRNRRIAIVNQLYRPTTLVLDPDEDYAGTVAGRELLIRLVPFDQDHVTAMSPQVVVGAHGKLLHILLAMGRGEGDTYDSPDVSRSQPPLLVVIGPVQFPSLVLKCEGVPIIIYYSNWRMVQGPVPLFVNRRPIELTTTSGNNMMMHRREGGSWVESGNGIRVETPQSVM